MNPSQLLDTKGLKCPIPVLKARKAIKFIDSGETLRVVATDPSAVEDFAAFCEVAGHKLLESSEDAGIYTFVIQKKA